jgi:Chalcone isomerase-like
MKQTAPSHARRAVLQLALQSALQGTAGAWLAGAASGAHAQAATPAEVTADVSQPQAAGTTRLKFFGLSIYDARLWVAPGFQAANFAQYGLALELSYLRSLKGSLIAERSLKEMRRTGNVPAATEQRWLAAMQEAFPDVNEGDRITGIHIPTLGARFYFNGQLRSTIKDIEFSQQFFGIWLAPNTSEPRMRTELLAAYA